MFYNQETKQFNHNNEMPFRKSKYGLSSVLGLMRIQCTMAQTYRHHTTAQTHTHTHTVPYRISNECDPGMSSQMGMDKCHTISNSSFLVIHIQTYPKVKWDRRGRWEDKSRWEIGNNIYHILLLFLL